MAQTRSQASITAPSEALAGTVERVTFHNPESGFAVLKVQTRGKRDLITVIGHAASVMEGEWITASGSWVSDRTHGVQFKAQTLSATPPTGAKGIEKYLASGQMRGIGPAMAKRIVAAFGEATFDVVEASPDRLTEVPGIGPWRASRITAGWAEQKAVREIMIFLHAHGVGTARAVRIFKTYGHEAVQVMTQDPYRLAREVRGIGFRTADAIASKLGMEKTAPQRIRAGISFALPMARRRRYRALVLACGARTETVIFFDIRGGLNSLCSASPNTSCSVCLPGGRSSLTSVCPPPKCRCFLSVGIGSLASSEPASASTSR
jgi:exodeoxyribonuclease V alpha subunit